MTKFVKGQWATEGESLSLSMPFAKVDRANRLVSGYATLDNEDSQGDIVLSEASVKAFARAKGNIREMHEKKAVGRMVDFREDEYYDTDSKKFYRGIFVTARVSEGAEDTWKKVLDGTLSGFSIGGNIIEASNEFVKESGKTIRYIKDYDLVELSLVDNPANQLANVFSIQKSATGSVTVKGMVAETIIENVFLCRNDQEIQSRVTESADCLECGLKMESIGWIEAGNNRAEKVKDVVSKFLSQGEAIAADENANGEGGVEMGKTVDKTQTTEEVTEVEDNTVEKSVTAEVVDETAGTETEETEKVVEVEEVVDEEETISKKIDELKEVVNTSLEKTRSETSEQVATLEKKIDEIHNAFVEKTSELEEKFNKFGTELETAKSLIAEFEKSLETINSSEALKKSSDLESEETIVQKSKTAWNGAFSVDNLL